MNTIAGFKLDWRFVKTTAIISTLVVVVVESEGGGGDMEASLETRYEKQVIETAGLFLPGSVLKKWLK